MFHWKVCNGGVQGFLRRFLPHKIQFREIKHINSRIKVLRMGYKRDVEVGWLPGNPNGLHDGRNPSSREPRVAQVISSTAHFQNRWAWRSFMKRKATSNTFANARESTAIASHVGWTSETPAVAAVSSNSTMSVARWRGFFSVMPADR